MVGEALPGALRVLLIDDHRALRDGLRASLASEASLQVVGATDSMAEGIALARSLEPQLIVCEAQAGGKSAIDLLAALKAAGLRARVLILTANARESAMRQLISAGASAYLLKLDGYAELIEALRVVGAGRRFFSDSVESLILAQYAERVATRFAVTAAPITPREREVLARIGQGQTNKAIAKALKLSVKTVEKHRSNLMRKLGLHNTAAVTVYAMRQGLIEPDSAGAADR